MYGLGGPNLLGLVGIILSLPTCLLIFLLSFVDFFVPEMNKWICC